jgi:hypothetical protein
MAGGADLAALNTLANSSFRGTVDITARGVEVDVATTANTLAVRHLIHQTSHRVLTP